VRFAGYKHPHPLENDILVKVQTSQGSQPTAVLAECAKRLEGTFTLLQDEYRKQCSRARAEAMEIGEAK
jgi:DNA-directed RNA polymerase II subunit RPB11